MRHQKIKNVKEANLFLKKYSFLGLIVFMLLFLKARQIYTEIIDWI